MATPATGALIGTPASINARLGAAHGSHGGGAVGLRDLRDHANRVGEIADGGHTGKHTALGQTAVTDFTSLGTTDAPCLTHTEGGKL